MKRRRHGPLTRDKHGNAILPVRLHHVPRAPTTLDKTGRKAWRYMAGARLDAGCLTAEDLPLLERYALNYQTAENAAATIKREGLFIRGKSGRYRWNPANKIHDRAWDEMIGCAAKLLPGRK